MKQNLERLGQIYSAAALQSVELHRGLIWIIMCHLSTMHQVMPRSVTTETSQWILLYYIK